MKGRPKTFDQKRRKAFNPANDVPVTILSKVPPCPRYFTKEHREIWKQTAGELIREGRLMAKCLITLEFYCSAVVDARRIGRDKQAKITAKTAARKEVRIHEETLGLTPAAHSKMKRPMAATPVDSADDQTFAELVN